MTRSLRFMEGFGIHTFRMVNAEGKSTFVRFHWKPRLGVQSLIWDESAKLQGADNDSHRPTTAERCHDGIAGNQGRIERRQVVVEPITLRTREVEGDSHRRGRIRPSPCLGQASLAHTSIRRSGCLARSARTIFSTCAAASSG